MARPSDFAALFVGQDVFQLGQCRARSLLIQAPPHLFKQAGSQVHGNSFLRGEDQWRHIVAAHQSIAAVGTALGVDRNAHLVQHRDVALNRSHRDSKRLRQLGSGLVGLALQQHDQGNQSGCRIGHVPLP